MLSSRPVRLARLLKVQAGSAAQTLAQVSALKKQMPLLYVMVLINSATVAYTHLAVAPHALVLLPLLIVAGVSAMRAAAWMRLDVEATTPKQRDVLLRRTNRLAGALGTFLFAWALMLDHYSNAESAFHLLYFLTVTSLGCIFCLMHLRSAALIVACCVTVPVVAFMLHRHGAVPTAMAVDLVLITVVIGFVLFLHYDDFLRLVRRNEELLELGRQNERLATTDLLTGLPNRRTFFPALEALAEGRGREGSLLCALINLHAFKRINEIHGRQVGDRVLSTVASRLAALPSVLLARVGGDEFALIAEDGVGEDAGERLGAAIRAALAEPADCGTSRVELKAAVGVAGWSAGGSVAGLLEHVNYAVAEARAAGRPIVFGAQHLDELTSRLRIEAALQGSDLEAELSLAYQPMVDVDTGRTFAFEALARWRHPVLGPVRPDQFIVAAERMGVISRVTLVLLGKLLRDMATWPTDVRASFNLSMHDITSTEAVSAVIAAVEGAGARPEQLQFEITETAALKDFALAQAGLRRLRALGGRLALDDFGTGYSSLGHVHRLPVDKLKIDSSFTRELTAPGPARGIIASIIGLAHGLNMECVVEGVETTEQAVLLRGLGCRLMQGYLFARPMPAAEVCAYLAREAQEQDEAVVPQAA